MTNSYGSFRRENFMVRRDTSSIKILPEPFASSLPRRIKIVTTTCGAELMDFAFAKATSAVILNAHDVLINFVTFQLMDFKFRRKPSLRHQPFPPVEFIGFASQFSKTATIPDISTNDVETCWNGSCLQRGPNSSSNRSPNHASNMSTSRTVTGTGSGQSSVTVQVERSCLAGRPIRLRGICK